MGRSLTTITVTSCLYFARAAGLRMTERWWRRAVFRYLLSSPGPCPPRMTECHRLRLVTSHSPSFDFPEPDSWWTASLWEYPPRTLQGGKKGAFFILPLNTLQLQTVSWVNTMKLLNSEGFPSFNDEKFELILFLKNKTNTYLINNFKTVKKVIFFST